MNFFDAYSCTWNFFKILLPISSSHKVHLEDVLESAIITSNPRRACAARVTVVSVCQCVQASHPLLTQLQDQVDIPMDSVSCSLQIEFGVFRIMA